jgi:hypothetical protein
LRTSLKTLKSESGQNDTKMMEIMQKLVYANGCRGDLNHKIKGNFVKTAGIQQFFLSGMLTF